MMPKFLLIKPPADTAATLTQSIGLAYLAAVLEKKHFPVQIIDSPAEKLQATAIVAAAVKYQPDVIGITSVTQEINRAVQLAGRLKKRLPRALIVLGGPHPTATPQETVLHAAVDLVAIGEGEQIIIDLANCLKRGQTDFSGISGLAVKKNNRAYLTPPRHYIQNVDTIPFPARHLLPPLESYQASPGSYKNLPIGTIFTTRGCPFHCTFCARSVFGNVVRFRSPQNVVDEIECLVNQFRAKEIRIWDDTFNLMPERVIAICREIIKRRLKFTWTCQARVNFINPDMLGWMKKAGCWQISFGAESGNQQIINRIHKGLTPALVERAVGLTKKAGIEIKTFFMIGLPGDNPDTMQQTIDFAKKLDPDIATFSITTPFPGTDIYREAVQSGEFKKTAYKNYLPYESKQLSYIPKGLTQQQLFDWQKKAYHQFYFRPKIVLREIKKIKSWTQLKSKFLGLASIH